MSANITLFAIRVKRRAVAFKSVFFADSESNRMLVAVESAAKLRIFSVVARQSRKSRARERNVRAER